NIPGTPENGEDAVVGTTTTSSSGSSSSASSSASSTENEALVTSGNGTSDASGSNASEACVQSSQSPLLSLDSPPMTHPHHGSHLYEDSTGAAALAAAASLAARNGTSVCLALFAF